MKQLALVAVSLAIAAGGAADARRPSRPAPPPLEMGAELTAAIKARSATRVAKLLGETVRNYGIWFTDAACAKQFGEPGVVTGAELQPFAKCLAQLRLLATTRQTAEKSTAILTYDPGVELELAHANGRVQWIGFLHQTEDDRGRPTLTVQAFEALRKAGKSNLDATVEEKLEPVLERAKLGSVSAWLKLCIDEEGALDQVNVLETDAPEDQAGKVSTAFEVALRRWRFRPFDARGKAMAVCTMTLLTYPMARAPLVETLPATAQPTFSIRGEDQADPVEEEESTEPPRTIPPTLLEPNRTGGDRNILPDDVTKTEIQRSGKEKLVGSFKLCLDARGAIANITQLKSTGFPGYDAKIMREMKQWTYKPYVADGQRVAVCTAVTFIYSQAAATP